MTSEPTGAYSAKVDTGLVTALRASILIESILVPLTGFHLGGRGFRGYSRRSESFASPEQIA
jgi:hypothetical protein